MNEELVAIIGGGPSGLTALKSLLDEGLKAVLFEQHSAIGGQWNQTNSYSAVWDTLRTNSSKYVTAFSDLAHKPTSGMYPGQSEILQYLQDYRDHFGLEPYIQTDTRVDRVERLENGKFLIYYSSRGQFKGTGVFSHLIIAPGRFNQPFLPEVTGLGEFKGGIIHASQYKTRREFAGKKVLVVGTRVSGSEIASDLSFDDSISVISSCRKPKYILTKMITGQPGDHLLFNRMRYYSSRAFTPAENARKFKDFILKTCGNPADFGGLKPSESLAEAGITVCEHYLRQVQGGRILTKGPISHFGESKVVFQDGTESEIDVVIFATGYKIKFPFLSEEILALIQPGEQGPDLYKYSFHPAIPNLAFIGMYAQIGPKFPSFELQARWIAGCWSGNLELPSQAEMLAWMKEYSQKGESHEAVPSQEMILMFAQAAGVDPDLSLYPEFAAALLFGPLVASQFRLQGHGNFKNAKEIYLKNCGTEVLNFQQLSVPQREELSALLTKMPANGILHQMTQIN